MRPVWTEPALRDLAALRAYIARDNPAAATARVQRILTAVAGLQRFPESGLPGRRARTRELAVGRIPFLVPYRLRGDAMEILRVLHCRQRWPDRL